MKTTDIIIVLLWVIGIITVWLAPPISHIIFAGLAGITAGRSIEMLIINDY